MPTCDDTSNPSPYTVAIVLTDESDRDGRGPCMFSAFDEPLSPRASYYWIEPLTLDDGTPDFGAIYRAYAREYGRCQSRVYVDAADGRPVHVGWFFVKRARFDNPGSRATYLQGAWVKVRRMVAPERAAIWEDVAVTRGVGRVAA